MGASPVFPLGANRTAEYRGFAADVGPLASVSEMFSVVRVGVGKVKLAMQLVLPSIARPAELEPATGHALRRFVNAQEYVDGMPKAIWLQRFPGL